MIECSIYTTTTKDKVVKPSQWKSDAYIGLKWHCLKCGEIYMRCTCEGAAAPKLEGMDAVYAYEDDHPRCGNCGEVHRAAGGDCMCQYPVYDDGS